MKIYVDFSVFSSDGTAVGRVSGTVDLVAVPPLGSFLMLNQPRNGTMPKFIEGFTGRLRVTELQFQPSLEEVGVAASLEDVVVPSVEDARELMRFFQEAFGLSPDEYELGLF
ncbi:hypothetical protein OOT46_25975 [Aquabacterium sp. A7-Y]|uniref:hypothetical protein n=1 Tax=Aquabacterium sp. A7-Y TaxID=1349605 RepID=UPI00223D208A|nr:hypothetical protein [Aquabacterium sp. A7-Y]MCW7541263.1 hypothetical protein [Aquabacterium sp. A7-Y]